MNTTAYVAGIQFDGAMRLQKVDAAETAANVVSEQNLSYGELADWRGYFETLAEKFDLTEEFSENGVI